LPRDPRTPPGALLPRALCLFVALAAGLASCTGGGAGRRPHRLPIPADLSGRILVLDEAGAAPSYSVLDARTGETQELRTPALQPFEFYGGAYLGPKGTAYLMKPSYPRSQLFQVAPGNRPRAIGPATAGYLADRAGDVFLATSCDGAPGPISVMRLGSAPAWTTVAQGCTAALSPDGRQVAFTPAYRRSTSIWVVPADGSAAPRQLVDLAAERSVSRALVATGLPRFTVSSIRWGKPGIAVLVEKGHSEQVNIRSALIFRSIEGELRTIPIGESPLGFLSWQPGGSLLGFSDCLQCTGFGTARSPQAELRLFDAATGSLRQISTAPQDGLFSTAWSPDGRFIATRRVTGQVAFLDPQGRMVHSVPKDLLPQDWGP
jgi:hypothetical protein